MSLRVRYALVFFLAFSGVHAQTGRRPMEHKTRPVCKKDALAAIGQGDELAAKGGVYHAAAMDAYRRAATIEPNEAEVQFKMGVCLLNGPEPHTAVANLQRAVELDAELPRVHFLLGCALQLNARWEEAIAAFQQHERIIRRSPDADRTFHQAAKHINECLAGKRLMAGVPQGTVHPAGPGVNTSSGEYGPLLNGLGALYFTSRRPQTGDGKKNTMDKADHDWSEALFQGRWTANGWSAPGAVQGWPRGGRNEATVAMVDGGRGMIIFRAAEHGGDLFTSVLTAGQWSNPVALPFPVNSTARESSAWRTDDGQWLYFVSDRAGGMGGSDIYRCAWDKALASWGAAENLGPAINTPYDEEGVCASADGTTIHFASRGHNTMGGFDLFKATCIAGRWSVPENLGWPVNSPGDDQFLVLGADGRSGYFSSIRPGGLGDHDIYRVDFAPPVRVQESAMLVSAAEGVPLAEEQQLLRLIGFIKGLKLMEPVEATVELMSLDEPDFQATFPVDETTGRFMAEVPAGKPYALHVKAEGYLLHSEHVDGRSHPAELTVDLKPATAGCAEVMRNILFDHDTFVLDTSSVVELKGITVFLQANPALRVEVGGHTDSDLGPIPNQELSEARAQVVVDWLVAHGIARERLQAKGYGDAQPCAPNDTRANKALNRRTEIRVL